MAPGEDFESSTRETLLDVVLDKLQKAGKTVLFSRLIYVASFTKREQNADELRDIYAKILEKLDHNGEVTGMLMVYPSCMVHILEARSSTLMSILREVHSLGSAESHMAGARVIASTEDIPFKCFSAWHSAFINLSSSADVMEPADAAALVKNATEVNTFLRKVGPALSNQSEAELRRRLSSINTYFNDTPTPELILSLVPSEEAPSLEEFLEIFDSPVNVDLDSEQVWPIPSAPRY